MLGGAQFSAEFHSRRSAQPRIARAVDFHIWNKRDTQFVGNFDQLFGTSN
jgi:hypothetical protein